MVFQDPYGSLDPRQTILRIVSEPLHSTLQSASGQSLSALDLKDRATLALSEVGLRASDLNKYPHEFSGGQRQRIAIARALITRPWLIVADEPVSALDVSIQAQVLNLLMDLQDRFGLSYLFVSHDLAVVNLMCDDVIVLQQGQVVEAGTAKDIFQHAQHAYTQALLAAIPGYSK
jgi:peptide/nickel transport system ATP-binding protein